MPKIAFVMGTRPEVIKLAPVILAMRASGGFTPFVISTGQHVDLCPQALRTFQLEPDLVLELHRRDSDLSSLSSALLNSLGAALEVGSFRAVVVQGDTSTAFFAALTSFYAKIPIFHVEAGLRTGDLHSPWPEEANRQMLARIATFHFPPTPRAHANLLSEGITEDRMEITGNTIVDAIELIRPTLPSPTTATPDNRAALKTLLVTGHRRENAANGIDQLCEALIGIVARGDCRVVFPMHPSPVIRERIHTALAGRDQIELLPAQDYSSMLTLLRDSHLVLTDSGGIQEEAPSFGKPVLVFRNNTERPEAVESGSARIVGTDASGILEAVNTLLDDPERYQKMAPRSNPFGDGLAARRIVDRIGRELGGGG